MTDRPSDDAPCEPEIRVYLDRIVSSRYFRNADTQSKLLGLAVERALQGQSLSEYEIGIELFGHYDQATTHKVRVHASIVRKKIDEYYNGAGKDDLVRIALPPGRAYKAILTYHLGSVAVRKYKQALAYREYASYTSLYQAIRLLEEAIALEPSYAPAYSAHAQCVLLGKILTDAIGTVSSWFRPRSSAWSSGRQAVELNENCWSGHIAIGAERLLSRRWKEAEAAFAKAFEISPTETRTNLWYAAYLMTVGKIKDGLAIAEAQAQTSPDNFMLHVVVGFFFYAARDFKRASELLYGVNCFDQRTDWRHGLVRLILATICFSDDLILVEHPLSDYMESLRLDTLNYRGKRLRTLEIIEEREGRDVNLDGAKKMLSRMRKKLGKGDLDLAVAYMAVGNQARAIVALRRAYRNENIFINWLHLLPIFDPLREHPRFRELLDLIAAESSRLE